MVTMVYHKVVDISTIGTNSRSKFSYLSTIPIVVVIQSSNLAGIVNVLW